MLFRELIYRKENHRRLNFKVQYFFLFKKKTNHSLLGYHNVIASTLEV